MSDTANSTDSSILNAQDAPIDESAPASVKQPKQRFGLWLLLISGTLFFDGCENNHFLLSLGPVGPVARFEFDGDLGLGSFVAFSPLFLICNLLVIAALTALVYRGRWRFTTVLSSRRFLAATILTTALFNSLLFWDGLWIFLVHWPIFWVRSAFDQLLLFVGLDPRAGEGSTTFSVISRFYFVFCIAVAYGLMRFLPYVLRKYLFAHPDRWWQFSLSGLLAAMVILGTGLGLLLRLIGV